MNSLDHKNRIGRFTSSEIGNLMTYARNKVDFGKPALTYIKEKRYERKLLRTLSTDFSSKPTSWGNFIESRVFDLLGLEYTLDSKETIIHPTINCWSGTPDVIVPSKKIVGDIKSPYTLKSFCDLVEAKDIEEVRAGHKSGNLYFWQLVSNAILTDSNTAQLIVYMPYQSELTEIRDAVDNYLGDQNKIAWINWADTDELPGIPDASEYKNLNIITFEVTDETKKLLTDRVKEAAKMLEL